MSVRSLIAVWEGFVDWIEDDEAVCRVVRRFPTGDTAEYLLRIACTEPALDRDTEGRALVRQEGAWITVYHYEEGGIPSLVIEFPGRSRYLAPWEREAIARRAANLADALGALPGQAHPSGGAAPAG